MNTTRLPDQHHIDEISRRLWSGREIGKAAVMVGAGFSRNARPINPTAPHPPLLENIAEELFETLYPANSLPEFLTAGWNLFLRSQEARGRNRMAA